MSSLSKLIEEKEKSFSQFFREHLVTMGDAITVDGVLLKNQNRHFYDFTLHHVNAVKGKTVLDPPQFCIKSSTALFVEGLEVPSASNLRERLSDALSSSYGVDFDSVQKTFRVVTEGAAVMFKWQTVLSVHALGAPTTLGCDFICMYCRIA